MSKIRKVRMARERRCRTDRHQRARWIVVIAPLCVIATGIAAVLAFRSSLVTAASGRSASVTASARAMDAHYPKLSSSVDYNGNGIDDYTDIMLGARRDAQTKPVYDAGYYQGGYPPANRGACTDTVWRAFKNAGYDLKSMVDADIAADPTAYAAVDPRPDPNIDFRRTGVLDVFFHKYGRNLTNDISDYGAWQRGDIVVFEHVKHIAVVSDRRDGMGTALLIHNMNQDQRENDYLAFARHMAVSGHYRFDASRVPKNVLRRWR